VTEQQRIEWEGFLARLPKFLLRALKVESLSDEDKIAMMEAYKKEHPNEVLSQTDPLVKPAVFGTVPQGPGTLAYEAGARPASAPTGSGAPPQFTLPDFSGGAGGPAQFITPETFAAGTRGVNVDDFKFNLFQRFGGAYEGPTKTFTQWLGVNPSSLSPGLLKDAQGDYKEYLRLHKQLQDDPNAAIFGPYGDPGAEQTWVAYNRDLAHATPEKVASIQNLLLAAGLLTEDNLKEDGLGWYGDNTIFSLRRAAIEASAKGLNLGDLLTKKGAHFQEEQRKAKRGTAAAHAEQSKEAHIQALTGKYYSIWGTPPPPGLVDKSAGMNIFEFEYLQRQNPAFKMSPRFQQERIEVESDLARKLGSAV
jgi:hypothetical protein